MRNGPEDLNDRGEESPTNAELEILFTLDEHGIIRGCDDNVQAIFEVSHQDVVGQHFVDALLPQERSMVSQDVFSRHMRHSKSAESRQYFDLQARRVDGGQFPIEVAFSRNPEGGTTDYTAHVRVSHNPPAAAAALHESTKIAALHAVLSITLAGEAPLEETLQACCQHLVDSLDAALARVWLTNNQGDQLELSARAGTNTHLDESHDPIRFGEMKIGRIASQRKGWYTNDMQHDVDIVDPQWVKSEGVVAFAGYPLVVAKRVVGVIDLFKKHDFSAEVFRQMQPMADAIAQCILRKRTEEGLIERERRLDLALDAGRLGTWEWDITSDQVVWSKQLYDIFGYRPDQFTHTRAGFLQIIHPDDRGSVERRLNDCFTGTCETYQMEFRIVRGDDQSIVWTSGRGNIQRDETGRPTHIIAAATDVTERKSWELELADREAHLRRVIDHTLFFIGVLDSEGTLLEANSAALQAGAVDRGEVIGKKFWDCYWWNFDEDSRQRLQDAVRRAAAGELVRYDVVVRMAADARMPIDFMLSPVRDSQGRITHLIPSGVDIRHRKVAEQQLATAKTRLDLAMEVSQAATWGWNVDDHKPVSNPNLNRLFGFEADDARDFDEFLARIDEGDRERVRAAVQRSITEATLYEEEYRVNLPNGKSRWLHARGQAQHSDEGQFEEFHGVILDVTEHKLIELELADREAHLRRVINNQLGLVGVIGRDGKLLEIDDGSLRIAGVTREDVIGQHYAECPWWTYDEKTPLLIRQTMDRAFAGETVRFDIAISAAGQEKANDRLTIDFMVTPVRDQNGRVTHLIASGVDISDRVEAEEARKDNEERLRMALRAGGMAAWEWNPQESVWTDDVFELLGITRQTASPDLFFRYVHSEDLAELKEAWQRATLGQSEYSHEFRIIRPDGEVRWIVGVGEVVYDEHGNAIRIFGLNWDSTSEHLAAEALRKSEQEAQLANNAKSEFLANMSHEIRTPMTAVLGYADLLLQQESDAEKLQHLQTIQRNGNFLLGIINDILDLSKIEAGKLEISHEWFSVADIVCDVRSMMNVRAAEKDLTFEVRFDGDVPSRIQSDPKRLRQVLINLVGNAIKFTESGVVHLTVREIVRSDQTAIEFVVVDTGIGISVEQQRKLFQPFSQGDASITRSYGGTGLGLAISHRLVGMLGGAIAVKSEAGKGSQFTFSIAAGNVSDEYRIQPQLADESQPTFISDAATNSSQTLNCRVYVVDDRRDVRYLSSSILSGVGACVEQAVDGLEAVERMESDLEFRSSIDLILLDMQMPRLDGYDTARRLRNLGFTKPIVALTADAMQDERRRCIEAGCDAFLSKPINSAKLIETVAQLTK